MNDIILAKVHELLYAEGERQFNENDQKDLIDFEFNDEGVEYFIDGTFSFDIKETKDTPLNRDEQPMNISILKGASFHGMIVGYKDGIQIGALEPINQTFKY